jgi:hypothetical protein
VWNVPARCEPVIDRTPLLAAIGRTLRARRPVVLAPGEGRAGVGVTTAMIEFAHRNRDDYDIVWWIAAQDPQLVGQQMAQLATTESPELRQRPGHTGSTIVLARYRDLEYFDTGMGQDRVERRRELRRDRARGTETDRRVRRGP